MFPFDKIMGFKKPIGPKRLIGLMRPIGLIRPIGPCYYSSGTNIGSQAGSFVGFCFKRSSTDAGQ